MVNTVAQGPNIITGRDGNALDEGYLYIGDAGENPEASPAAAYWDDGLTDQAQTPIRIKNGQPSRDGAPASLFVDGEYSITVRDERRRVVSSTLRLPAESSAISDIEADIDANVRVQRDTFAELASITSDEVEVGEYVKIVANGGTYKRADDSATDNHLEEGLKWYVVPLYGPSKPEFPLIGFGAAIDGTTDDATAFATAMTAIMTEGGGALTWSGRCYIGSEISATSWDAPFALVGRGGQAELKTDVDDISLLYGTLAASVDVTLENVDFIGAWDDNNQQSSADRWLVHLGDMAHLTAKGCGFYSSQKGGLKANVPIGSATIENCAFERLARGGCNISGVSRSIFSGSRFKNINDDAISLHTVSGVEPDQPFAHVVTGSHFEDTQGIAALGCNSLNVTGNVFRRMRGRFLAVGYDSTFDEGVASITGVSFTDNIVMDTLNWRTIVDDGDLSDMIQITPYTPQAGGLTGVPGGASSSGGIVPYYGNNSTSGTSEPIAGAWFIRISNNTITRTKAAVTNYSDWGEGDLFTEDGFVDPEVTDSDLYQTILIQEGVRNCIISDNIIQGISSIRFSYASGGGFKNVVIARNDISDCSSHVFDRSGTDAKSEEIYFLDNNIDGDPFYIDSGRSNDGTWSAENDRRCFDLFNMSGWHAEGNRVKNISRFHRGLGTFKGNYAYGQLASISFSTSNAGIGLIDQSARTGVVLVDYDADTASSTFGQIVHREYLAASAQPTTGYFMQGMFIKNTATTAYVPDGNDMVLSGWARRTTGNGHTSSDWTPVYLSSVSPAT